MWDFRRRLVVLVMLMVGGVTSCSPFSSKKPPIILILLESFSEQDYLCSDTRKTEELFELQEVCKDFLRLTHVYSPSTLTQTNVASIMTGLSAQEHGVFHNGNLAISSRLQTIAESAINSKMRTGLFSGGVPLVKKFGVGQGFEEFSEPFLVEGSAFFQPFSKSVEKAMNWLDEEVRQRPFFMTFYVPDLLYKNRVTEDGLDNERPVGRASSVQEIHESINNLVAQLKKRNKWNRSHVIVLGLSGPQHSLWPYNPLSSQYLHVPMQIKLSHKFKSNLGDLTSELFSFSRIGKILEKLIQHKPSQGDLIFSPEHEERFIAQQNAWSFWRSLSSWKVVGLRKKQYLFSFNPDLMVFDTFFDKKEYEPIGKEESRKLAKQYDVVKQARLFFKKECFEEESENKCPSPNLNESTIRQLSLLTRWSDVSWSGEQSIDEFPQRMAEALRKKELILIQWLAYRSLIEKKWVDLFELGQKRHKLSWSLLAQLNLRENPSIKPKKCLRYFVEERKDIENFYRHCQDSSLRRVVEGLEKLKHKKRPSDSFWSEVSALKTQRAAKMLNVRMFFMNDVHQTFDLSPTLAELYFFLPENNDYLGLIDVNKS